MKISKKTKERILSTIPLIQAEPDESKREEMLDKAKFKPVEICEVCQSPTKMYGLCCSIERCMWDASYIYFKAERPVKNSIKNKNVLDDECLKYVKTLEPDMGMAWVNRCSNCSHFEAKDDIKASEDSIL